MNRLPFGDVLLTPCGEGLSPPEMRGRAMSLNTLPIMCVRPLGDFPAGAVIARLGFRATVLLGAALVGTTIVALWTSSKPKH
jgi:hypothetical protein